MARLVSVYDIDIPSVADNRGKLCWLQKGDPLPFEPKRVFYIYGAMGAKRGGHAHREDHQFLVPLSGSVTVHYYHHQVQGMNWLHERDEGLYVPPLTWLSLDNFSVSCILLVLSSGVYRESDYIRDPDEFVEIADPSLPPVGVEALK